MSINLPVHACLGVLLIAPTLVPESAISDASGQGADGMHAFDTRLTNWTDPRRDRVLPIKLYLPEGDGPFPVVIFSHGLGGSREAAPYLGEHWAAHGFIGVFVQHPGTDRSLLQGVQSREDAVERLNDRTRDIESARARFEDIPFVIDEIERQSAAGLLAADPSRIGMSGHSYGAATTIAVLGRRFGPRGDFTELRIDAGIALSPTAPPRRVPERMHARLYDRMDTPMLHLTGTEDIAAVQPDVDPAARTIPFQMIPEGEQYLVVFDGGDHSVFGGRRGMRDGSVPDGHPEIQAMTAEITTAFWQAYLNGDEAARDWLSGEGLDDAVRSDDVIERRNID